MPDCPTCGQDFDGGADMFDVIRHVEECAIQAKADERGQGEDEGFDTSFDQYDGEPNEESWGLLQDR